MDVEFCTEALEEDLSHGGPEIFNTDQGSQFTSRLLRESIQISMDGKGRAIENVMVKRLWRSVKYEEIYLKSCYSGADCYAGVKAYFHYYTHGRPHQALGNRTPWEAFKTTP